MLRRLYEYFITADDYNRQKDDIAQRIIARQSRGNTSVQNGNGSVISLDAMEERGRKADKILRKLQTILR